MAERRTTGRAARGPDHGAAAAAPGGARDRADAAAGSTSIAEAGEKPAGRAGRLNPHMLLLLGVLAIGLGMAGVILGVVVPGTFLIGVFVVATGMLVCGAAGLWLALTARDEEEQEPA